MILQKFLKGHTSGRAKLLILSNFFSSLLPFPVSMTSFHHFGLERAHSVVSCLKRALLIEYPLTLEEMGYLCLRNLHGCNSLVSFKVGWAICTQTAFTPSKNAMCQVSRKTSTGNQTICSNHEGKSIHWNVHWAFSRLKWLLRRLLQSIS